ncbi:hypothetical protein Tco_1204009 [Tanacetum coccineum]
MFRRYTQLLKDPFIRSLDAIEKVIDARALHEEVLRIKEREVKERRDTEKQVNESEMQKQERMANKGTTSDACLDSTLSRQQGECSSPRDDTDAEDAQISQNASKDDNVVAKASHDKNKITEGNTENVEHDTNADDQHRAEIESSVRNVELEAKKTHKINA